MPFGLIGRIGCKEVSGKRIEIRCWNIGLMSLMGGGCRVGSMEVVGGGGCEMKNFDGVGGDGSNVGSVLPSSNSIGWIAEKNLSLERRVSCYSPLLIRQVG